MVDPVGKILGNNSSSVKDERGRVVKVGDTIEDANGNRGKVTKVYGDRLLVNFGQGVGPYTIGEGDERFVKVVRGKGW